MTKTSAVPAADKIVMLRKSQCPNTSGSATLEYAVGQDKAKAFYVSIRSSSGGGYFSDEWVAWKEIEATLADLDPITSLPLQKLLKGKSVNTGAFLMAALLAEGLVERLPDKQRYYRLTGKALTAKKDAPRKTPAKKKARSPAK